MGGALAPARPGRPAASRNPRTTGGRKRTASPEVFGRAGVRGREPFLLKKGLPPSRIRIVKDRGAPLVACSPCHRVRAVGAVAGSRGRGRLHGERFARWAGEAYASYFAASARARGQGRPAPLHPYNDNAPANHAYEFPGKAHDDGGFWTYVEKKVATRPAAAASAGRGAVPSRRSPCRAAGAGWPSRGGSPSPAPRRESRSIASRTARISARSIIARPLPLPAGRPERRCRRAESRAGAGAAPLRQYTTQLVGCQAGPFTTQAVAMPGPQGDLRNAW